MSLTLAITGGTGFVGGHTLAVATARGHKVRALARRPQPEQPGVEWIAGALDDETALKRLVEGADVVIHIAGVVNGPNVAAFEHGNVFGTAMVRRAAGALPFVHVSSLAAREPGLSAYGASKRRAEDAARDSTGPVTLIRPPGVYGPGDRDLLLLFRTLRSGFAPIPRGARASMVFAPDLAAALVALAEDIATDAKSANGLFEIDDGFGGYSQAEIAHAAAAAMGRRIRVLQVPGSALQIGAAINTIVARMSGGVARLSFDRARYLAHPDWTADVAPLLELGLWQPTTSLATGLAHTIGWYRRKGWL